MNSNMMKISTIHSYKGWESPTVILVLQPEGDIMANKYAVRKDENCTELIYTAITRAKKYLFIMNMGNNKYDEFFKNYINGN